MRILKAALLGLSVLLIVVTVTPSANATWLGLADGTYDVTLTCVTSSVIPCPSTIDGTMTIAGAGATAFDFVVNGQSFVGAPTNNTVTTALFGTDQVSVVDLVPFSGLSLEDFLTGGFPGLSPQSWGYCNNFDATHCTPDTAGNWTAVAVAAAVPEPPGIALFVLGLGIMALAGVTRRRSAQRIQ
jgi:hypothetical protein